MTKEEIRKYDVIKMVLDQTINGTEAANMLNLSVRQIRRLKPKVKKRGAAGVIHASRGQAGHRSMPIKEREKILTFIKKNTPTLVQPWPRKNWRNDTTLFAIPQLFAI